MNGEARLRLEFIACNGHHKLTSMTWVGLHTTASGLFQCLITSIMNDEARLRVEFIACNGHHKLTIMTWVGLYLSFDPHYSHQDWVFLDQCKAYHSIRTVPMSHHKHTTAAGLFQYLITSIMNDEARLRLEIIPCNGHHKLSITTWAYHSSRT
eukprot:scaffold71899_cov57-Cyclotella_meneghiniana.AAC.1